MMMVPGVIAWVGLGALLVWAASRGQLGGLSKDSPENVLKRRYAEGQITREEFKEQLRDLQA